MMDGYGFRIISHLSNQIMPYHITSHHITSYHIITSCHITSHRITAHHVTSHLKTTYHIESDGQRVWHQERLSLGMCVVECSFWWSVVVFSDFGEMGHVSKVEDAFFVKGGEDQKKFFCKFGLQLRVKIRDHQRQRFEIINGKIQTHQRRSRSQ